jgi:multidrug resistance efflux pump
MSRNAMVRGHLTEIGTRLEGVVTRVEVDAGERVTAGQILARLEDRHFRAEAQEAQAELEGLQRELEVERSAIVYEERRLQNQLEEAAANLEAAAAQVVAAESQADDARAFHKARNLLLATGAIPSEEVRNAQAKSRTADALAKAAKAEHAAAQSAEQRARLDSDLKSSSF